MEVEATQARSVDNLNDAISEIFKFERGNLTEQHYQALKDHYGFCSMPDVICKRGLFAPTIILRDRGVDNGKAYKEIKINDKGTVIRLEEFSEPYFSKEFTSIPPLTDTAKHNENFIANIMRQKTNYQHGF